MFNELWEILITGIKKVLKSRLFVVSILFIAMFGALVFRLFKLQIVNGEDYQENYVQKTLKTVSISGTRGDIYDRNGNLLAYNELAYAVTVGDSGYYKNGYQRNKMLLKLIPILEKHGETLITSLSIAMIYRVYLYPQVYDFFVKGISQRYRLNRTRFKQIFDFSCLLVSCAMTLLLFHRFVGVGFGTLIMTVCNGFLIGFFDKWLEKHVEVTPLFAKLAGYFDLES